MKPHAFDLRVYFEDTDAGGVVYNANYLKFYERARTEFLRDLGYEQDDLLSQGLVFVVKNIAVDFLQAARFNDRLRVITRPDGLKKASLVFEQAIYRLGDDGAETGQSRPLNRASVKVACVATEGFRPLAIPDDIRAALQARQPDHNNKTDI